MDKMLPTQNHEIPDFYTQEETSYTYHMVLDENRMKQMCNDLEAVKQAVYKIINTERYQYLIYSWKYGVELADLFGKPISYCVSEIERRIQEALLMDDRIMKVKDFQFDFPEKRTIHARFTVVSIKGEFPVEKEVMV